MTSTQQTLPLVRGFTLVEMITVIAIMGLLAATIAPIFSQGIMATNMTRESLDTMAKLRYGLERIVREVRQVNHNGVSYDLTTMQASSIAFTKNDSNATQVVIQKNAANINVSYSVPNTNSVLTDEVDALIFRYLDISGNAGASSANVVFVEITLTLINSATSGLLTQRTRVALRDKS